MRMKQKWWVPGKEHCRMKKDLNIVSKDWNSILKIKYNNIYTIVHFYLIGKGQQLWAKSQSNQLHSHSKWATGLCKRKVVRSIELTTNLRSAPSKIIWNQRGLYESTAWLSLHVVIQTCEHQQLQPVEAKNLRANKGRGKEWRLCMALRLRQPPDIGVLQVNSLTENLILGTLMYLGPLQVKQTAESGQAPTAIRRKAEKSEFQACTSWCRG